MKSRIARALRSIFSLDASGVAEAPASRINHHRPIRKKIEGCPAPMATAHRENPSNDGKILPMQGKQPHPTCGFMSICHYFEPLPHFSAKKFGNNIFFDGKFGDSKIKSYLCGVLVLTFCFQIDMTSISITYNEKNTIARKAMEFLLSLGVFKVEEKTTPAKRKTLKAIEDARKGRNMTQCNSFEEYLKAVEE